MEDLGKVLDAVGEAARVSVKVGQGLKAGLGLKSAAALMELLDEAMSLVGVTWDQIDEQWKLSRAEDHATMKARLKAKFSVADDAALEGFVEEIFELAGDLDASLSKLIALGQKL